MRFTMIPLWFWILGWLLTVVTVIGNGLVIYLIITKQRLHTTANWFILSLAVADSCVGMTLVPSKFFCEFWPAGYCTVLKHFRWFFIYASTSNLCAMAGDRYASIVKPLRYITLITPGRLVLVISVAWGLPTSVRLIMFSVVYSIDKKAAFKFVLPVLLFLFEILPCALLLLVTIRMFLIARKISRQVAILMAQLRFNHAVATLRMRPAKLRTNEMATVRVTGVVVILFVMCYIISLFISFSRVFRNHGEHWIMPEYVETLRRLCLLINSAANPIAYAFLKKDIRRELTRSCARNKGPAAKRNL